MLPLKDDIPTERVPLATIALILAGVALHFAVDGWALVPLLASLLLTWIFGVAVEGATARWRFALLCAAGAGATVGAQLLLDPGAVAPAVAGAGVAGTLAGAHLALHPRARVFGLVLAPLTSTFVALPSWLYALAWLVLLAAMAVVAPGGIAGPAEPAAWAAPLAGLVVGLAAARPLARRRPAAPAQVPVTA